MARCDGYKTQSRQEILNYLKLNKNKTVTAASIYCYMNHIEKSVNRTTIYRYLDKLVAEGKLIKYVSEKGDKSSYQYIEPGDSCHEHLHLQCVKCGKVVHMDCEFMNEIKEHIVDHHGFHLQCDNSILYGICDKCEKKMQ